MIWIFWEMTSGIVSVCSAPGLTVDTCSCQSTRLWGVSHIFYVNVNSDLEVTSWLSLSTETGTHSANCAAALFVEMAQVQFLDKVFMPVVVPDRCIIGPDSAKPWNCRSCSSDGCVDVAAS